MKETLKERLDRIGAEAEAAEADQIDRPLPPHVKVSRPNRARSKVLQVRLNPEELEAVERIAQRRGLPVSTVAREQLLRLIEGNCQIDPTEPLASIRATLLQAVGQVQDLQSRPEVLAGLAQRTDVPAG